MLLSTYRDCIYPSTSNGISHKPPLTLITLIVVICLSQILIVLLLWLKKDLQRRRIHASTLLQNIRLGLIPGNNLIGIIMKELPELLSLPDCYKTVERVLTTQGVEDSMFITRTTFSVCAILKLDGVWFCKEI